MQEAPPQASQLPRHTAPATWVAAAKIAVEEASAWLAPQIAKCPFVVAVAVAVAVVAAVAVVVGAVLVHKRGRQGKKIPEKAPWRTHRQGGCVWMLGGYRWAAGAVVGRVHSLLGAVERQRRGGWCCMQQQGACNRAARELVPPAAGREWMCEKGKVKRK